MDKEHARFILRCFRPDGADAAQPDFAAALQLAAADRELGEWLARERADDAAFARALQAAPVPDGLRDEILAGLAAQRGEWGEWAGGAHPDDGPFIGALASIAPPVGLRGEILRAMERGAALPAAKAKPLPWLRLGAPLAAAAGIVFAFALDRPFVPPSAVRPALAEVGSRLPVNVVQAGFVRTFETPGFTLEHKNRDHAELFEHLHQRDLPCGDCGGIPKGLRDVPALGCRELEIDGHKGSLVCFDLGPDGIVHLILFRRDDIEGDLPCAKHPRISQSGAWSAAAWCEGDTAFVLLTAGEPAKLAAFF